MAVVSRGAGMHLRRGNSNTQQHRQAAATINNTIFLIEDWAPYYIQGLEEGENQIKLELIDSNGNLIETPFNPSIKTFMIEK